MMTKEEIIDMAKKCGWDNPAINMSPLYEFAKLIAEKSKKEQDMPVAIIENNSQNWKGMDGAIAWHLIERHAVNWADVGKMMNEWLFSNTTPQTKKCDECGNCGGYALYCVECAEKFFEAKLKEKNN